MSASVLLDCREPFPAECRLHPRGMLPVSSRSVQRIVAIMAALSLTAMSTIAAAREFRAADTQAEDYSTVQALNFMGSMIAQRSDGRDQIRVFHSRQLGEEKETIDQTR